MRNTGIYFGRFQPFHKQHIERVAIIRNTFPDVDLIVGVADWKGEMSRSNFLTGMEALTIATLSLADSGFNEVRVVGVPLSPEVVLGESIRHAVAEMNISYVFSGSDKTLSASRKLVDLGLPLQIVDTMDDESGIRATDIRTWMINGDHTWKDYVTPSVAKYFLDTDGRLIERLRDLSDGSKRPWSIESELPEVKHGNERR